MKEIRKNCLGVIFTSIVFLGCSIPYTPIKVEGMAMFPNFKDGDKIFVERNINDIKRGDIIFFKYPKDTTKLYFKRVIGLPNEIVFISKGRVFINVKQIDEPYLDQSYNQLENNLLPIKVPARSYFVLGDNRDNSSNSRSWGTVKKELIIGKYHSTYWSSN